MHNVLYFVCVYVFAAFCIIHWWLQPITNHFCCCCAWSTLHNLPVSVSGRHTCTLHSSRKGFHVTVECHLPHVLIVRTLKSKRVTCLIHIRPSWTCCSKILLPGLNSFHWHAFILCCQGYWMLMYCVVFTTVQRVGTESVTFLSNQENNGTLYSIPGTDVCFCVYRS